MQAIIVHQSGKMESINAVLDTELSRNDLLRIINNQYTKIQRMQEDYNALLEMNKLLEQQNQRLLREKFSHLEAKLKRR